MVAVSSKLGGRVGLQARVRKRYLVSLPPLRSRTSAAEAVFFVAAGRGAEAPLYPSLPDIAILKLQ